MLKYEELVKTNNDTKATTNNGNKSSSTQHISIDINNDGSELNSPMLSKDRTEQKSENPTLSRNKIIKYSPIAIAIAVATGLGVGLGVGLGIGLVIIVFTLMIVRKVKEEITFPPPFQDTLPVTERNIFKKWQDEEKASKTERESPTLPPRRPGLKEALFKIHMNYSIPLSTIESENSTNLMKATKTETAGYSSPDNLIVQFNSGKNTQNKKNRREVPKGKSVHSTPDSIHSLITIPQKVGSELGEQEPEHQQEVQSDQGSFQEQNNLDNINIPLLTKINLNEKKSRSQLIADKPKYFNQTLSHDEEFINLFLTDYLKGLLEKYNVISKIGIGTQLVIDGSEDKILVSDLLKGIVSDDIKQKIIFPKEVTSEMQQDLFINNLGNNMDEFIMEFFGKLYEFIAKINEVEDSISKILPFREYIDFRVKEISGGKVNLNDTVTIESKPFITDKCKLNPTFDVCRNPGKSILYSFTVEELILKDDRKIFNNRHSGRTQIMKTNNEYVNGVLSKLFYITVDYEKYIDEFRSDEDVKYFINEIISKFSGFQGITVNKFLDMYIKDMDKKSFSENEIKLDYFLKISRDVIDVGSMVTPFRPIVGYILSIIANTGIPLIQSAIANTDEESTALRKEALLNLVVTSVIHSLFNTGAIARRFSKGEKLSKKGRGSSWKSQNVVEAEFEPIRSTTPQKITRNLAEDIPAADYLNEFKNNPTIGKKIEYPSGKCDSLMEPVADFMKKKEMEHIRFRAIFIWDNATSSSPMNHFVVVGKKEGKDYVIDLTAQQFGDRGIDRLNAPLILEETEWAARYSGVPAETKRLIKYKDFSDARSARTEFNSYPVHKAENIIKGAVILTTPKWYLLQTKRTI
ncbi:hypothetical protein [Photorhabdus sp. RM71S]|uniref:hypothetical protein n=1 Tax=Photorhabdus sp. RM71S TaxID=3342824 RepID=UPI0036DE0B9D